jgi:hypothetical protein
MRTNRKSRTKIARLLGAQQTKRVIHSPQPVRLWPRNVTRAKFRYQNHSSAPTVKDTFGYNVAVLKMSNQILTESLSELYSRPLPAARSGALYSAFSYPTKISPETIAIFIATHTKPGDTILDTFGGSGTTGVAVRLCENPTPEVIKLAKRLDAPVTWGRRNAIIYELSAIGSFVARIMSNPPDAESFLRAATALIDACESKLQEVYAATDELGNPGFIRHAIWSDIIRCDACGDEISFWDGAIKTEPVSIASAVKCPSCGIVMEAGSAEHVYEQIQDPLTGRPSIRRKRQLKRIYGQTGARSWSRPATGRLPH